VRHPSPAVGFIFVTILLDVLGFGLLIPVAPRLVKELGGGGESAAAAAVGGLASLYAAMQFLFAPVLGSLSDRFGRRPILLFSLLGSGLDYFAMALSPTLALLFLTRAINGLTGASMTVANAYTADVTTPARRAAAFGLLGAAFGLGFVLGPLLGGTLGNIDIRLPFYVAGSLALLNWLYGALVLPESLSADRRRPLSWARTNPVGVFAGLRRYPLAAGLAAVLFLFNLAQFGLHATWVLYTEHRYHWSPSQVGWSLAIVGAGAAIVQGGLARHIIPRLGEPRAATIGLLIGVAAYVAYGLATRGWMIYAIVAVASLGAIAGPAIQSLITRSVDPREQGEVQGALAGLNSVAGIIGYSLGANLFGFFISARAPLYLPGASFFMSAALSLAGLAVAVAVLRRFAHLAVGPAPASAAHPRQPSDAAADSHALP
jgi:DHA1 family tetracycline resistance protein-like MFS transporter